MYNRIEAHLVEINHGFAPKTPSKCTRNPHSIPRHIPNRTNRLGPKLSRPLDILDVLEGLTHADDAVADHAGVEAEGALDGVLSVSGGVEAHDEVVAGLVQGLVLAEGLGEQEGAPVGYAADDAVAGEDEGAGGFSYPDLKGPC